MSAPLLGVQTRKTQRLYEADMAAVTSTIGFLAEEINLALTALHLLAANINSYIILGYVFPIKTALF